MAQGVKFGPLCKAKREVSYDDQSDQSFCDYIPIKLCVKDLSVELVGMTSRLGLVVELLELVVHLGLVLT